MSDLATLQDNAGQLLPHQVLTDAKLIFPADLGLFPFVSGVAVSRSVVSVLFSVAADAAGTDSRPLASVTVALSEFSFSRQYPIEPKTAGVTGWVAFGNVMDEPVPVSLRFSTPAQSLLQAKAFRAYSRLPVTSFGKLNQSTSLTGLVPITVDPPLEIVGADREINGTTRRVAVLRLVQDKSTSTIGSTSVFEEFIGPCDRRPESQNCLDREALEFLATVPPDCEGKVTVEFRGCAKIAKVDGEFSITIDCGLGLSGACPTVRLPDADGYLPGSYPDECAPEGSDPVPSGGLPISGPGGPNIRLTNPTPLTGSFGFNLFSPRVIPEGSLPFSTEFESDNPLTTLRGSFELDTELPALSTANSVGSSNLAVWDGFNLVATDRKITTSFVVYAGEPNARNRCGLVLNHRDWVSPSTHFELYIDFNSRRLVLDRVSNSGRITLFEAASSLLQPGTLFVLSATIKQSTGENVAITCEVVDFLSSDPTPVLKMGPILTKIYYPDDGLFGIISDRANARFGSFSVSVA